MKRILLVTSLLLGAIGFSTSADAQVIGNVTYNDSCYNWTGGTVISNFVRVNGSISPTCIVETNHGDGSKKDTSSFTGGGGSYVSWGQHTYTVGGVYTLKHTLICGGNRIDSQSNSVNVYCSYITGFLYNDVNINCVRDASDPVVNSMASIQVDSAGVIIDTLQANGMWIYRVRASATTVYKFTLLGSPAGYVRSCPATNTRTYTYNPSVVAIPSQDFGFNCSATPVYDYQLFYSRQLRGASSTGSSFVYLNATNSTCHAGTATVTFNVSPKYSINTSGVTPTPASISGNTIVWTFTNLAANHYEVMYIPLTPKTTTHNGDTACMDAIITPTAGDVNVANNSAGACDSVRESWDPNEKAVKSNGPVAAGSLLNYTIDFENLGNDTAFNIHIQDTLSQNLDAGSFALLGATHRVTPSVYELSNGTRILKFDFPGINLEDKSAPTRNKGQVRFSMKLRQGLATGTSIPNRAGIYFDGNPVVLTNYAYARIPVPESVPGIRSRDDVSVYPNPAQAFLQIEVKTSGWNSATLSNALGQTVLKAALATGVNVIKTASLPAGIYYLQIGGEAGIFGEKIEKR